jgi:phage baseplate assembly protein V
VIRGIVKSVVQGVIQRISASVWGDGSIDDRELFQHYGYTSRPKPGAEVIFIRQGNHFIAIASDDRRYRISLEEGEVALYTDEGDKIHLKRDRTIEIIGGEKIIASTKVAEITATTSCTVTSPEVTVVASTKVTLDTPMTEMTGDVKITGALDVTGAAVFADTVAATGALSSATSVSDPTGSMEEIRTIYNSHNHSEHGTGGGTTSAPTQGM